MSRFTHSWSFTCRGEWEANVWIFHWASSTWATSSVFVKQAIIRTTTRTSSVLISRNSIFFDPARVVCLPSESFHIQCVRARWFDLEAMKKHTAHRKHIKNKEGKKRESSSWITTSWFSILTYMKTVCRSGQFHEKLSRTAFVITALSALCRWIRLTFSFFFGGVLMIRRMRWKNNSPHWHSGHKINRVDEKQHDDVPRYSVSAEVGSNQIFEFSIGITLFLKSLYNYSMPNIFILLLFVLEHFKIC